MSAEIIQLRDYQQKRDLDRLYTETVQQALVSATEFNAQIAAWPDFYAANAFHGVPSDKEPA